MFNKIQSFIEKNSIKPSDCSYHTMRDVANKEGKMTGKVRVLVLKKDGIARVEYICPFCGHYGYLEKEWKRPFRFKCENCGKTIRVPKLKK